MGNSTEQHLENLIVTLIAAIAHHDPLSGADETLQEVLAASPEHRGWLYGLAWGRADDDDVIEAIHALAVEGGFTPPYERVNSYPSTEWAVARAVRTLAAKGPKRRRHG